MRAPNELIGSQAVSPSGDEAFNARKMTPEEIMIRDDFVTAALRAKESGYDGVELWCSWLSARPILSQKYNRRTDRYGVTRNGRFKLIEEIRRGTTCMWSVVPPRFAFVTRTFWDESR